MKRNLIILFLFSGIIFVTINIFNSNVVTKRKIDTNIPLNTITKETKEPLNQINIQTKNDTTRITNNEIQDNNTGNLPQQHFEIKAQDSYNYGFSNEIPRNDNDFSAANEITTYNNNIQPPAENYRLEPQPRPNKPKTFEDSIRMCFPYKESLVTDLMGLVKVRYTISILGWVNNKCILDFHSEIIGTGEEFRALSGDNSISGQITGNIPQVHCEFTKNQILDVGENLLQEHSRSSGMLKKPNEIDIPNRLDISDIKLLKIIFADKACKIINENDIFQILF